MTLKRIWSNYTTRTWNPQTSRAFDAGSRVQLTGTLQHRPNTSHLDFNGTSSYVAFPTGTIIPYNSDFTIEFWVAIDDSTNFKRVFTQGYTSDEAISIVSVNGQLVLFGGASHDFQAEGCEYSTYRWFHYAFVRKSGTVKSYLGCKEATSGSTPSAGTSDINCLGCRYGTSSFFDGRLHEFRIWNFAMPVTQLYYWCDRLACRSDPRLRAYWPLDEGSGTTINDVTGNGWDGTAYNCTWV